MSYPRCEGGPHNWVPGFNGMKQCRDCGQLLIPPGIKDDTLIIPVAIQRLIDEVKADDTQQPSGYNRVYSRHNRS